MKRFHFTLEAVQTIRERSAREALENYARAVRARTAAEAGLASAENDLARHLEEWRKALGSTFSPGDMLQHEHAREMLENRRKERAQDLRKAQDRLNEALAAFQVARQKREVVERFHARQRHEFNLSALKEEQHLMDEMATSRHEPGLFEKGLAHA